MKISAFADVGLRVMMALTSAPEGTQMTTQQLADAVGSPYHHVSKTVTRLGELGVIRTARGRNGGSSVTEEGMSATVGGVLRELETRLDPAECLSPRGNCPLIGDCQLRFALRRAQEAFYRDLESIVISALPSRPQRETVFASIGIGPPAP
ncbi:nitric oxide-sensing transcriptional repressor NsrR [Klugiella xanthotipulae]|uniref:BadM/Rrf2 family transcriptional regulator n=1 Tax=Klugiella xanthotipulae TaxID=244735 RepID=A0A543I6F4_9MICO|nr:Rrf2 family transcriptional regulator [Klugiella xanthotipulae]TQM66164.1 BadM/Rrf2 family transcriptional regulator [Klugiella xanthotipulae]